MMRDGNRLRPLKMCIARHENMPMAIGKIHQYGLQHPQCSGNGVSFRATKKPKICRNLIVSAPGGVQFRPGISNPARELGFDVHVNVLKLKSPFEPSGLDVLDDCVQP
jgi:hypothetical protein